MLVEAACEITLKKFVVIDRLGDDAANKFEVTEVFAVVVGERVDGVRHTVVRRYHEQRVVGVEYLARHDDVPLPEQTSCILALFACTKRETII